MLVKKKKELNPAKKKEKVLEQKKSLFEAKNVTEPTDIFELKTMSPKNRIVQISNSERNKKPAKSSKATSEQIPLNNESNINEMKRNNFNENLADDDFEEVEPVKFIKPQELEKPSLEEISEEESESDKENKKTLNVEENLHKVQEFLPKAILQAESVEKKKNKLKKQDLLKMIYQLNEVK